MQVSSEMLRGRLRRLGRKEKLVYHVGLNLKDCPIDVARDVTRRKEEGLIRTHLRRIAAPLRADGTECRIMGTGQFEYIAVGR